MDVLQRFHVLSQFVSGFRETKNGVSSSKKEGKAVPCCLGAVRRNHADCQSLIGSMEERRRRSGSETYPRDCASASVSRIASSSLPYPAAAVQACLHRSPVPHHTSAPPPFPPPCTHEAPSHMLAIASPDRRSSSSSSISHDQILPMLVL